MKDLIKAKEVAMVLTAHGFKVIKATEWDMEYDGEVVLENGVTVQIGDGYMQVNKDLPDFQLYMSPSLNSVPQVIKELKGLVK